MTCISGAAVTDFDGDGQLDLLVTHGESAAQPISVYRVTQGSSNKWLRVIPRTQFGAFARGAKVIVYTKRNGPHMRVIDGGSGYLCEMEPVAHFGLVHPPSRKCSGSPSSRKTSVRSADSLQRNNYDVTPGHVHRGASGLSNIILRVEAGSLNIFTD
ncbi:cartilage acidic protein 1-like [Sinocyclocheilus rhinocerous]|uniref:cartilage acidic protein 1-like n=1 Tax=Sinocyclocheilus rhinocerous TaxID=307959 RepID=UPI0007BA011D|nr:PREDICTED: cartilage acidic protein 1-like [Sinocyclocheilus rhinocerous]